MSRFSLRPHSFTCGLPGIGRTQAHANKPLNTRQTHHKLATLDPLVAQKQVLSDSERRVPKAKILIERMSRVEASVPVPAAPRNSILKAFSRLGRGAAIMVGLKHRKPQPHVQLVRYANTRPDKNVPPTEGKAPATLHDLHPALVHTLEREEAHLDAWIDADHAAGLDAGLTADIDRVKQGVGLAARRATNLADQAHKLRQHRNKLEALLEIERKAIATATESLDAVQSQLSEATQELDLALLALEKKTDEQSATVSSLEQKLKSARIDGCDAAKMLFFRGSSLARELLERRVTYANEKIEKIQSELAVAQTSLLALQQHQQQLRHDLQSPPSCSSAEPTDSRRLDNQILDEQPHETNQLAQRVAQLERADAWQRAALQACHTRVSKFEQRLRDMEVQFAQTLHFSKINAAQLWEQDDKAADWTALKEDLQPVLKIKADARDEAKAEGEKARAALEAQKQALLLKLQLLDDMPGFRAGAGAEQMQEALLDWAKGLEQAISVFGVEALPASAVLTIGMQALSNATKEDPAKAAQALGELRVQSLHTMIPPPGDPADALANMPTLTESARATASLLASVPRGMQVLVHLLVPGAAAPSKEQLDATRIYLRADNVLRHMPPENTSPEDTSLRQWLANAKMAAQRALHARSTSEGLATATDDERAAFYGFHNGYESNAPDSAYDKANQHLQMLADWLHDAATSGSRRPWQSSAHNPLHALREGLQVGAATGLPTPASLAREELATTADHLAKYLLARRQQLPPGQVPSAAEVAMQAVAEYVQGSKTDLTTLELNAAALQSIEQRQHELLRDLEHDATRHGSVSTQAPPHPALDATWQILHTKTHTLPEAMSLLQQQLQEQLLLQAQLQQQEQEQLTQQPELQTSDTAYWSEQETEQHILFHAAVDTANRLLHDGDPAKVTSGQAFHDLFRDMLEKLEWRDKLRIGEQKVNGVNLSLLSAALAVTKLATGIGFKLIASAQHNEDRLIEFYMGRTGLYMQIGRQGTNQFQLGAGVTAGAAWKVLKKKLGVGISGAVDWRVKKEAGIEQGVQLRVPRRAKGQELELRVQFMEMFKHLLQLATPQPDGSPARRDWMRELLAHHPSLNIGLIENAPRQTLGTESNVSGSAMLRAGVVAGRPRRAGIAATVGVKSKQDTSNTRTTVAGHMTTIYRDSTAQAKSEVSARLTAGVQAYEKIQNEKIQNAPDRRKQQASLSTSLLDLGYAREIRAKGVTHFCTMFTFGDEIDPVRTDRASDFQSFSDFEREVRKDWNAWVNYGTPKLPAEIEQTMRYAVAEKQLENFLDQARVFAKDNKFATMYVDHALKAETAPMLDALRAQAKLWRLAGREDLAQRDERAFDDLMAKPALWEPAILVLREKTKLQVERGIDFLIKKQTNRVAESQRTVGQWVQYESVPHPEPGQKIEYTRTWTPDVPTKRKQLHAHTEAKLPTSESFGSITPQNLRTWREKNRTLKTAGKDKFESLALANAGKADSPEIATPEMSLADWLRADPIENSAKQGFAKADSRRITGEETDEEEIYEDTRTSLSSKYYSSEEEPEDQMNASKSAARLALGRAGN